MKLILTAKVQENLKLELKEGGGTIDSVNLTLSQGFDILLITSIDKLLVRNKIDRLSLKTLEIRGKLRKEAVSGMVLGAIKAAFSI